LSPSISNKLLITSSVMVFEGIGLPQANASLSPSILSS
jgi:hypothetical protein